MKRIKHTEQPAKQTVFIVITLLTVLLLFCSCGVFNQKIGSGNIVSKDVFIEEEFSGIISNAPGQIVLTKSSLPYISLVGDDNILGELKFTYNEGVLYIEANPDISLSSYTLFIYIPVSRLTRLESLGAGDFSSQGILESDNLALVVKGAGSMDLAIQAADINLVSFGKGDVTLGGECERFTARVDGKGSILASELHVKYATASVHASGNIEVYTSENLVAWTAGSGVIGYKGNPLHTELSYSVPGSIFKM
jgi:hypothetical protein